MHWEGYPQFTHEQGLGRIAFISFSLGGIFYLHSCLLLILSLDKLNLISIEEITQTIVQHYSSSTVVSITTTTTAVTADDDIPTIMNMILSFILLPSRMNLIFQWTIFILVLCIFHSAEFFITAMYNPSVVNASSFVVNHSTAYTMAMMISWIEFWIRYLFFPSVNYIPTAYVGFGLIIIGQLARSFAMITCGESFNHIIQRVKKDNHKLITSGIYKYLRHPSYFGFFYWSIGTQLMIGNFINAILFTVASWVFFRNRIPYEEETLEKLFPKDYQIYKARSWVGIPFIWT